MTQGTLGAQWGTPATHALCVSDDELGRLAETPPAPDTPIAVEVWVFSPDLEQTLLVQHRWRGWVPPGGKVDHGEDPRAAAEREVLEETGLIVELSQQPAAVAVRSFHADWSPTLALSYSAIAGQADAVGEEGQPVLWTSLRAGWDGYFAEDVPRLREHATWLGQPGGPNFDPVRA